MRSSVRRFAISAGVAALALQAVSSGPASARTASVGGTTTMVVLAKPGVSDAALRAAVINAAGRVVRANDEVGVYTVTTRSARFRSALKASGLVDGVASDRRIGSLPDDRAKRDDVEHADGDQATGQTVVSAAEPFVGQDPLARLQWDMTMISAPTAHALGQAGKQVRVGVMDTGVDGRHPDIRKNFNAKLSRNFTTDDPVIDGPCAEDPDGLCTDPANVDENGHGTHVAGTIASPRNGVGITGVAPEAEIVNLRTGQDSGYFFLQPTVDALTFAGDNGIDVVNMSYYIDPWLYNCAANPADSPLEQAEQRTIIAATNRALRYARRHGVTLIAAAGNENTDLNNPTIDQTSPDYPPNLARDRAIDNSCLSMPTEGDGVIGVSAVGPSTLKADYSNWGTEQITVAAPGGYFRDGFGTPTYRSAGNLILAPMPKSVGIQDGLIDPVTGNPVDDFAVKECAPSGECAYYQYLQGTSMAAPHATGVAALIVGRYGSRDALRPGLTLPPATTERRLIYSAVQVACPAPVYHYPDRDASYDSNCAGQAGFNGWYGHGIVSAENAVTAPN